MELFSGATESSHHPTNQEPSRSEGVWSLAFYGGFLGLLSFAIRFRRFAPDFSEGGGRLLELAFEPTTEVCGVREAAFKGNLRHRAVAIH